MHKNNRARMRYKKIYSLCSTVFFLSLILISSGCSTGKKQTATKETPKTQADVFYTCPMHSSVRLKDPKARCPICGMALVPVERAQVPQAGISFTPETVQRMNFQTMPVQRRSVSKTVDLQGRLEYDETRLAKITSWMPGRVERLFVDYTGMAIRKGEHMVELYSPELISAQEELLQANNALANVPAGASDIVRESAKTNMQAAADKLKLLGLSQKQVDDIAKTAKPQTVMTISAPISGIVTSVNIRKGQYVKTGTELFTIADLSHLWLLLDAYEADIPWISYGQSVTFTTSARPGKTFVGKVAFISPSLDEMTHTLRIRINVDNPSGELQPGMLAKAQIKSGVDVNGNAFNNELAGKWICPMHPGFVRDNPGKCGICGMDLVRAETLGMHTKPGSEQQPLVIPESAVLQTGKRSVVYVRKMDAKIPTYELREITIGPRADGWFVVMGGLKEGQQVVTRGAFKIDSERQIKGLPGMMSMPSETAPAKKTSDDINMEMDTSLLTAEVKLDLRVCVMDYLKLGEYLAADDGTQAAAAAKKLANDIKALPTDKLSAASLKIWRDTADALGELSAKAAADKDIKTLRETFSPISQQFIRIMKVYGAPTKMTLYQIHCPMAFDNKGADWLQTTEEANNPYFGAAMLHCGAVKATFKSQMNDIDTEATDGGK